MMEIRELLPDDILPVVLDSYGVAIRYSFLFCVAVAFLGICATLFIKQHSLNK
jgi:hypothetical protein